MRKPWDTRTKNIHEIDESAGFRGTHARKMLTELEKEQEEKRRNLENNQK